MIAQDTGSAIVGPARADLYFGAGPEAGRVSGRLRHNARFVMLVPKSLDPSAHGRKMPLPDDRPSEKIAKLFPQTGAKPPATTATIDIRTAPPPAATTGVAQTSSAQAAVPLPEPRPIVAPASQKPHHRHLRRYRYR